MDRLGRGYVAPPPALSKIIGRGSLSPPPSSGSYACDLRSAHTYIKSRKQESTCIATTPPLKNKDGFIHSDDSSNVEILNDHFVSAYTRADRTNLPSKGAPMHGFSWGLDGDCLLIVIEYRMHTHFFSFFLFFFLIL